MGHEVGLIGSGQVFESSAGGVPNKSNHFAASAACIAVSNETVFMVDKDDDLVLKAMNWGGTLKQTIPLGESDGSPFCMDVCGNFLAVCSRDNTVRIFNIGRREVGPPLHCMA